MELSVAVNLLMACQEFHAGHWDLPKPAIHLGLDWETWPMRMIYHFTSYGASSSY